MSIGSFFRRLGLCLSLLAPCISLAEDKIEWLVPQPIKHLPHRSDTDVSIMKGISHHEWKFFRYSKWDEQGPIIETLIKTDEYGFRITPQTPKKTRTKHLIFAGCSMAFGQGVPDDKTSISVLAELIPEIRGYNFGFPGTSVNEAYYLWRQYDFRPLVREEEGLFVYNLIADHFERATRTWRYLHWANYYSPFIDFDAEAKTLVMKGLEGETLANSWAKFIRSYNLATPWLRLVAKWDDHTARSSLDEFVFRILALKKEYLRQYPKGRFVVARVVAVPMIHWLLLDRQQEFFDALSAADVEVWDSTEYFKNLREVREWDLQFPRDGHPNIEGHRRNALYLRPLIRKKLSLAAAPQK